MPDEKVLNQRYKVIRRLGRGGMGEVYLVEDVLHENRPLALKLMNPSARKEAPIYFRHEFQALTMLRHPNLAEVYDFGIIEGEDKPFFTSEYVVGQNLLEYSRKHALRELAAPLVQVCRALEYIHSRGLIHHDIKPENILVREAGEEGAQVKVIDFGLVGRNRTGQSLTVPGTVHYIAPEIFKGLAIDRRSDLYSLGILLYQIATGSLPYNGASQLDVIRGHLEGGAPPPSEHNPAIPKDFEAIILRLMAREPWERFPSANAVIEALGRAFGTPFETETKATVESYILTGRFVGREAEFARLAAALDAAAGGVAPVADDTRFRARETETAVVEASRLEAPESRVLLVSGEAGIGKTRLLREFKTHVQIHGILYLEGPCSPSLRSPFGAVREILRELVRVQEARDRLPRYASEIAKVLPEVSEWVETAPAVPLKPEQERRRLVHGLCRWLVEVSASKPLVLHLADVQWADDITLEFLSALARTLRSAASRGRGGAKAPEALSGIEEPVQPKLLVCASARPPESADDGFAKARKALLEAGAEELPLRPLGQAEVGALIRSMLGMDHDPEDLAKVILAKTGGNPFFVEEVMRGLVEEGVLVREGEKWAARVDDLAQIEVPAGLAGAVERRLERLPASEREALRAVAVCTGPAPVEVVARALELDVETLLRDLSSLAEKEILSAEEARDGGRGYAFVQPSVKDAVVRTMGLRAERAMHRRIGKAFEDERGPFAEEFLEETATHFLRGRDRDRAFAYGLKAAEKAKRMHANREALDFYLAALEFAPAEGAAPAVREEIAALHEVVGELDRAVSAWRSLLDGGAPDAESEARVRRRIAEALRKKGDLDAALGELKAGEAALRGRLDSIEGAKLLDFLGFVLLLKGARDEAIRPLARALRISRRLKDQAQEGAVYNYSGHVYLLRGNAERAARCYGRSVALSEAAGNLQGVAGSLDSLGNARKAQGRYAEAAEHLRRGLEIRKRMGDIFEIADSLNNLGTLFIEKGDLAQALELEQECLRIRERIGDERGMGQCFLNLGVVYDGLERYAEALDSFRRNLALRERLGDPLGVAGSLNNLGALYRALGQYRRSEESLGKSLALSVERGWLGNRLNALSNLGATRLAIGDLPGAGEVLKECLAVATEKGAAPVRASALMTLGDAARVARDWEGAQRDLERAREIAESLGGEDVLGEVDTLRARLRLDRGDAEGAASLAREVLRKAEAQGLPKVVTFALLVLGSAEVELLQEEEALRHLVRARERAEAAGNLEILWEIHHALGNLYRDTAKFDTADAHYRKAQDLLEGIARDLEPARQSLFLADPRRARLREDAELLRRRMADTRHEIGFTQRTNLKKRITDLENSQVRLLRLLEINKKINSEHDLDALLNLIMDVVVELCDAERGFLILEEDGKFDVKTARNINREEIQSPEFSISHSIVQQTMQSGVPLILTNAQEDERFRQQQSVMTLNLRSVLCIPFKIRDRVLGALYLDNRLQKGLFSKRDLSILEAFGDQAAIAIENARLLRDNRAKAEKIEGLNRQLEAKLEVTTAELESARETLEHSQREFGLKYEYANIIGWDAGLKSAIRLLDRVVDSTAPCLIQGESGTGKELIAKAIHFNGPRKKQSFVSENCAAIAETLLESELFGFEKGAFTGADRAKKGLFEIAHLGTLFLDEISEMSLGMQAKLLRVLQEGEIRRVGGVDKIQVDVRILSATNRNLKEHVEKGLFREDLYYRISTILLPIPPVRDRRHDIPLLVDHFLRKICQERDIPVKEIDREVLNALLDYDWPGNVRELENEIVRLVTLSDRRITLADLSPRIRGDDDPSRIPAGDRGARTLHETVGEFEKRLLLRELEKHHWNKSRTAKELGISRVALHKKIAKYGIT